MWIIVGGSEVDKSDRHEPGYSAENNVNKLGAVTVEAMTATD